MSTREGDTTHRNGVGRSPQVTLDRDPGPAGYQTRGGGPPELGAPLGLRVPVDPSPPRLVQLRAPAGLVRTVVDNQDFDLRQVAADRLRAAADSPERTLAAVQSAFRGAADVELLSTRVGVRPMPADDEPIIGRSPRCPASTWW